MIWQDLGEDCDIAFHFRRLDEFPRRDDGGDLGRGAGRRHVQGAGGEIQHGGHAAKGLQAKEREQGANGIGQKHAHGFLLGREPGDLAAENEAAHDHAVIGNGLAMDVLDNLVAAAMGGAGIQQGFEKRLLGVRGGEHHVGHHIIKLVGLVFAQARTAQSFRGIEFHRRQEGDGDFGKPALAELAAHSGKFGELRAINAHGQDLGIGHLGNGAGAFVNLHQGAGHGDAAFGENHHAIALFHGFNQGADRQGIAGINGGEIKKREGGLHPPALCHMEIDGKSGAVGKKGRQQGAIQK